MATKAARKRLIQRSGVMTIGTDRLILRPVQIGDAEAIFRLASDPEVSRYLTWDAHKTIEDTLDFVRSSIKKNRQRKLPIIFAVFIQATNELIGIKSFVKMDLRKREAEVGTWLGKAHWGKGYSTEINMSFMMYGFQWFKLELIRFAAQVNNSASWRVAEKLGFAYLGETRAPKLGRIKNYYMSRDMWRTNHLGLKF